MHGGGLRRGSPEHLAHHHSDLIGRYGVAWPQLVGRCGQRGPTCLVQSPYLLIAQHHGDKLPAARIGQQADQPGTQIIGDKSHATIVQTASPRRRLSTTRTVRAAQ